jgi:urease accessory protein
LPNRVRLRADPAMRALIAGAGGKITSIEAPFEPEGGAYAIAHDDHGDHAHHHHDHPHEHDLEGHTHVRTGKR